MGCVSAPGLTHLLLRRPPHPCQHPLLTSSPISANCHPSTRARPLLLTAVSPVASWKRAPLSPHPCPPHRNPKPEAQTGAPAPFFKAGVGKGSICRAGWEKSPRGRNPEQRGLSPVGTFAALSGPHRSPGEMQTARGVPREMLPCFRGLSVLHSPF